MTSEEVAKLIHATDEHCRLATGRNIRKFGKRRAQAISQACADVLYAMGRAENQQQARDMLLATFELASSMWAISNGARINYTHE
jgi:hypothetical protein